MKRVAIGAAAALVVALASVVQPARAEIVDAIVATVDTEVILYSDLVVEVQSEIGELRRIAPSAEVFDRQVQELLRATLEQAIESKILYREAQLLGVEVTDEQVEARIDSLRELYPTNEAFMEELSAAGESLSEFRARTEKQIMSQRIYFSKLRSLENEVVVSEGEVAQYYEDQKEQFERPERIRVRQIFLRAPSEGPERARARARLELVREELQAGAEFTELARLFSQAPGAEEGGIIGWQQRGDLVDTLEEAAFSLGAGEISKLLETPGGVHILKVDEHQPAGLASLEEVRIEIEPLLRRQAAERRYVKWFEELHKRSRVRIFL